MKVRQSFSKFCTVSRYGYFDGKPLPFEFGLSMKNFIRVRHHANEAPLMGDTVEGAAVDITCGRVTDAWRRGKHMSEQFCLLAGEKDAFKTSSLAIKHVQTFLEKLDSLHKSKKDSVHRLGFIKSGKIKGLKVPRWIIDLSDIFTSEY